MSLYGLPSGCRHGSGSSTVEKRTRRCLYRAPPDFLSSLETSRGALIRNNFSISRGWCLARQEAPRTGGCPILCALCKGWDTRRSVSRFVVSHPSQKSAKDGAPGDLLHFLPRTGHARFISRGSATSVENPSPSGNRVLNWRMSTSDAPRQIHYGEELCLRLTTRLQIAV